jgi:hypothetical protein
MKYGTLEVALSNVSKNRIDSIVKNLQTMAVNGSLEENYVSCPLKRQLSNV